MEKRWQFADKPAANLRWDLEERAYGIFVNGPAKSLTRVLSNLINNAVEAYPQHGGVVDIELFMAANQAVVTIRDCGRGIPSHLHSEVFKPGSSFDKDNGNGMGLSHAKNTVEELGGQIELGSTVGLGTTLTITLPTVAAPQWFIPQINVAESIIIADDDEEVHSRWRKHLRSFIKSHPQVKIEYVHSPAQLEKLLAKYHPRAKTTILMDYDFGSQHPNGISTIKSMGLKNAILVTNAYEQPNVISEAASFNIPLIPKPLLSAVPLKEIAS